MRLEDESKITILSLFLSVAVAEAPIDLLRKLAGADSRANVTLHLESGRDLTGALIAVSDRAVLIESPDRATHVDVTRIEAVTVIPFAGISKTALGSSAKSVERGLALAVELAWKSIPDTEAARRIVARTLDSTVLALRAIAEDPEGKKALEKVSGLSFSIGEKREVRFSKGTLFIRADAGLDPAAVQALIEKQL
jgi:hypothetical protein